MAQTTRRTFFKGAAAVAVGATAPLHDAKAQTTSPATDHEAFIRLSLTMTGMTEKELPAIIEQRDLEIYSQILVTEWIRRQRLELAI